MLAASAASLLSACSGGPSPQSLTGVSRSVFTESEYGVSSSPRVASGQVQKGGGRFKLGSPYKVAGKWYVPRDNPNYDEYGIASWYGADFHGRRTANGEVFDANALTAAHPTLPLPCYVYVTNVGNGRTVLVRVNDRGPYVNDRLIDMSYAAAKQLGFLGKGRARVHVRFAGLAPLNGNDRRERQFLASQEERRQQGPGRAPVAPAQDYASAEQEQSGFSADASDQWDPNAYRAALAGKPAPRRSAAQRQQRQPVQTASIDQPDLGEGRMSLTAASEPVEHEQYEAPQAFAPAQPSAADNGDAYRPAQAFSNSDGSGYSGRAYVQVGIFRDRSNAERLRRELGSLGPVEVAPIQAENGAQVYRVRVGPFSQGDASRAQSRIATYGVVNTAIVAD